MSEDGANNPVAQVADSVLPLPGREEVEAVGIALGLCLALSAAAWDRRWANVLGKPLLTAEARAGSIVPSSW